MAQSATVPNDGSSARELELIDRARAALRASPEAALVLVQEHERGFARGVMAEEREVIRIAALVKLGQLAEAHRRGDALLAAYPSSAYARRIQALLPAAP